MVNNLNTLWQIHDIFLNNKSTFLLLFRLLFCLGFFNIYIYFRFEEKLLKSPCLVFFLCIFFFFGLFIIFLSPIYSLAVKWRPAFDLLMCTGTEKIISVLFSRSILFFGVCIIILGYCYYFISRIVISMLFLFFPSLRSAFNHPFKTRNKELR